MKAGFRERSYSRKFFIQLWVKMLQNYIWWQHWGTGTPIPAGRSGWAITSPRCTCCWRGLRGCCCLLRGHICLYYGFSFPRQEPDCSRNLAQEPGQWLPISGKLLPVLALMFAGRSLACILSLDATLLAPLLAKGRQVPWNYWPPTGISNTCSVGWVRNGTFPRNSWTNWNRLLASFTTQRIIS